MPHPDSPRPAAGDPGPAPALAAGDAFARQGRRGEAIVAWQRALDACPGGLEAHGRLGFALLDEHRFAEAARHFAAILAERPGERPARIGFAYALQRQGRHAEALGHWQRAAADGGEHLQVLLGLAACLRATARHAEAAHCLARALVLDPACVEAYAMLARLPGSDAAGEWLDRCEALQPRVARMPVMRQARYWFALGRLREDAGRFDAAFDAYAEGNRLRASRFVLDESGEARRAQRIREVFDRARMAGCRVDRTPAGRIPVFVVGMPRSGSTLIEQILDSCAGVHGAGEIADLHEVLAPRLGADEAGWPDAIAACGEAERCALGAACLDRLWARAPDASHIVDKLPLNYRHAGLLRMILPTARIVHSRRDALDTCVSCYTHLFEGDNLAYTYDLASLGRYYARYAALMDHWREVLPAGGMLEVRYEALVADTAGEARRLLAYVGLPWDPACLAFHRNPRPVATASRDQVREPIHARSLSRWRRFAGRLQPLREALATPV